MSYLCPEHFLSKKRVNPFYFDFEMRDNRFGQLILHSLIESNQRRRTV